MHPHVRATRRWLRCGPCHRAYAGGMSGSGSGIPARLVPPVPLVLAKAVNRFPAAHALPGTLCFEPKYLKRVNQTPGSSLKYRRNVVPYSFGKEWVL